MGFLGGLVFHYFGSKLGNAFSNNEGNRIVEYATEIILRYGERIKQAGLDDQEMVDIAVKHNNRSKLEDYNKSEKLDHSTKRLLKIGEPILNLLSVTGLDLIFLLTDVNDQYLTYIENAEDSDLIVRLYQNKVEFLTKKGELLSESESGIKHIEINFFKNFRDSYLSIN